MLKTVLVGSTLSEKSDQVVAAAASVAKSAGAALVVVHGFEVPLQYYAGGPYEVAPIDPAVYETVEEQHRAMLADQVKRTAGDAARSELRLGGGAGVLLDVADEIHPDLIVVGGSERGHIEERILGSTADRVMRGAHVPVLIVRPPAQMPPKNVLVAVDFSASSDEAFARGVSFLDDLQDPAEVTALFVMLPPAGSGTPYTHEEMKELSEASLDKMLKGAGERDRSGWATRIREGKPAEEIVAEVEESHPDLVIVGTHGRGGFRRFLLGSVASDVARRSPSSCLVVPPAGAAQDS